jgi:HNH endonuclease
MSVEIPMTRGFTAIVDEADAGRVLCHSWRASPKGPAIYAISSFRENPRGKRTVYLHRFILSASIGTVVDHKDHDGLNNRRNNLRFATTPQNGANQRPTFHNKHGYKGVTFKADRQKYYGYVRALGRLFYSRPCGCPLEAALARDVLAIKHHGDFVSLNFPSAQAVA